MKRPKTITTEYIKKHTVKVIEDYMIFTNDEADKIMSSVGDTRYDRQTLLDIIDDGIECGYPISQTIINKVKALPKDVHVLYTYGVGY